MNPKPPRWPSDRSDVALSSRFVARAKQHTADWDERFRSEDVPWEDDAIAPAVVTLFETFVPRPVSVLEIGCGLGTTAAWLAEQGHTVTACDISAEAISVASARAMRENLRIRWIVADALRERSELPQVDVVFTRGVLHTFKDHQGRKAFAEAIAETQTPGTLWLDLSGIADTPNDPPDAKRRGFPRLTLAEITPPLSRCLRS